MNRNIKLLCKNAIYTFISNLTSFLINALIVLIIPKIIGISEYGYYQLYILLATYALYFHFGWCDGIYLRGVGKNYEDLDKEILSSQFKGIVIISAILSVILFCIVQIIFKNPDRRWVYSLSIFAILVVTPKTFTSVIMQMVNKMKQYSQIVLIEKVVYTVILIIMLLFGVRNFRILLLADLLGKIAALILGMYFCRDIIFTSLNRKRIADYNKEALKNMRVGIFLLLSNLSSILITGIVQFCVEFHWDIEMFSKISLTFNMSKMLMVVITSISIVLVPMLKHMDNIQLANMYEEIRSILMLVLGAMLALYYPLKILLSMWLPQYMVSLEYMSLLFPMCLFESKTQLLINTYLKAMREEKRLCLVNLITVLVSLIITCFTVFILENLTVTILSIPYLLAFRCVALEYYIGKKLNLHLLKDVFLQICLTTLFIYSSWFIKSWMSTIIYLCGYVCYLFFIQKDLKNIIHKLIGSIKITSNTKR